MSGDHDAEPVFVRSKWGTSRYVYNANNPVGMALIVGSLLFAAASMYLLHDESSWSEGELHDAVHAAVKEINGESLHVGGYSGSYEEIIADAIEESGEGPEHGYVTVSPQSDHSDDDSKPQFDQFEVSSGDVSDIYCLNVSPPEPETFTPLSVVLTVTVDAGSC
ncbi:hypothetical protein ABZ070_12370 [Streptomyces sp. NPDC006283]|uniref:hypothetical protein n=1 Tax=Streptomyces sp. NPDC006283 TaxID=3156741 RepID=UPI0033AEB7BE